MVSSIEAAVYKRLFIGSKATNVYQKNIPHTISYGSCEILTISFECHIKNKRSTGEAMVLQSICTIFVIIKELLLNLSLLADRRRT